MSARTKAPNNGAGRPKGAINKTTAVLKEAILAAAEQTGEDGAGRDGLIGYLRHVARDDLKAFTSLLGKVLPMQVTGDGGGPVQIVSKAQRDAAVAAASRADL